METVGDYNSICCMMDIKAVKKQLDKIYAIEKARFNAMDLLTGKYSDEELEILLGDLIYYNNDLNSKKNTVYFFKLEPDVYLKKISVSKRKGFIDKIERLKIVEWRAIVFLNNYLKTKWRDTSFTINQINNLKSVRRAKLKNLSL